ncbi:MAG: ATP-dependent sacrificial sulfur transferase LarE [Lacrimispora sp.]
MEQEINSAKARLEEAMAKYAKEDICLAFSGGVDSSLLLKAASDAVGKTGKKVYAVTFDSRLHPSCDLAIAARVAKELGGIHKVVSVDELEQEEIRYNPVNRCYLCKKKLFQSLKDFAGEMNIRYIMDGTNEDDLHVYRPGIKALRELEIISPLAELHITKAQVKAIAAGYGISVASRPSSPCMATRLPYHTEIDYNVLERIGKGEEYISSLIKGNVRLRLHKDIVRIEVDRESMEELLERSGEIISQLKELGFTYITMDLEGFRSGSMDVGLDMEA